jgi:SRSO17 transposase
MGNDDGGSRAERFSAYLADLASVLGDARRCAAMISYCTGLLLPSSVEPMAALTAPTRTAAQHQSLLHFVGQGEWSDEAVMERIHTYTIPRIERHRRHFRGDTVIDGEAARVG